MSKLFISHSSKDDGFVHRLQQALGDLGQDVWIDSRHLRGGDPLWSEIQQAIDEAESFAVVVSTDAFQSKWVAKELRHALSVQKKRGGKEFPVVSLSLNGTKLGMLEEFFDEEPIYIPVTTDAGGIDAALHSILVALGKRHPADVPPPPQPKAGPLEELVLELTGLKIHEENGVRRPAARARLVHEPATPGREKVQSRQSWRFIAPLGPIEAEELRWYLEKYAVWPSGVFRGRARKVEENLVQWGRLLHERALPVAHTENVMKSWEQTDGHADRRFSVHVDTTNMADAPDGRLCLDVTRSLLAGDPAAAASLLQQVAADPDLPAWLRPFIHALQAVVAGSRERTLADAPDLDYTMAAEILFLIETLEKPR